jgi:hypothetical protein
MKKFESTFFRIPVEDEKVSLVKYANALTKCYEQLDEQGYEVINVVPVNLPHLAHGKIDGAMGLTTGAVVIGKAKSEFGSVQSGSSDNLTGGKTSQ